ncbi:hypothetical protein [Phormidium tenue]|uniref:Uncharacterized protein n=1 Tax=Phormidium tenue NIES-30 TaxID=549789 RepID=A0A1U7IY92_9CYAN|nr:hypothetical protein [Phormidium tenue]MBD2234823.1 hypothetical protein [Phormidium tenue FACHB-1052]OKH43543.1 hypothetical protein NIES30_24810 [Phormidium tenue NIES-30]
MLESILKGAGFFALHHGFATQCQIQVISFSFYRQLFFPGLERAAARNLKIKQLAESSASSWVKQLRKLPLVLGIVDDLLPLNAKALRGTVR